MDLTIAFVCVAYLCLVNTCIGLYIGFFGLDGFISPRLITVLIVFLALIGIIMVFYAQHNFGFHAQPNQIGVTAVFFVLGLFVGRLGRPYA